MADLTVTAANVFWVSGPTTDGNAGEAVTAGMAVYRRESDGAWLKAQVDGAAAEAGADGSGVALNTADRANAPLRVARHGSIVELGAGLAGVIYTMADTAGGIRPNADNGTTDKVTPIGIGIGSNRIQVIEAYNAGSVLA